LRNIDPAKEMLPTSAIGRHSCSKSASPTSTATDWNNNIQAAMSPPLADRTGANED